MTPMPLERALQWAIESVYNSGDPDGPSHEALDAAATLRAFQEAHKAATEWVEAKQPEVTEALARLKALEEEIIRGEISIVRGGDNLTPITARKAWAKEIATIRKALGSEV